MAVSTKAKAKAPVKKAVPKKPVVKKEVLPVVEKEQEVAESAPTKEVETPVTPEQSIHKVETFNNEQAPPVSETSNIRMNEEDKIYSMKNAIKILPPNMIVNGRHTKQNIQAICGFMVTDAMWDKAYEDFTHETY